MEQVPFGTNSFAENPEPRVASVLLLDVSGSMAGAPIAELNAGLTVNKDEPAAGSASSRVEVAIVTFGGVVQTVCDFTTADSFQPPVLAAGGNTPMGEAIREGVEMVRRRKDAYRARTSLTGVFVKRHRPSSRLYLRCAGGAGSRWRVATPAGRSP